MKIIFRTLVLFLLISGASFAEQDPGCISKSKSNPCKLTRAQVMTDIFEQVVLKVSDFLVAENVTTLEDFANILGRSVSTEDDNLINLFSGYARADQFSSFVKDLPKYSYWNKDNRLSNNQAALVILLANEKHNIGLTQEEIDVIWFIQNVNEVVEDQKGKYSYEYNLYNLSNQIVKLTGAMKDSRVLNEDEAESLMRKITHINCFESYRDFLDEDMRTLFWDVLFNERELTLNGGTIYLDGEALFNPSQIQTLIGSSSGSFDDDRGLIGRDIVFHDYFNKKMYSNDHGDIKVIKDYHKDILDIDYAIVDKKVGSITLYNSDGFEIDKGSIQIGMSDRLNHSGAGIYQVEESEELYLISERGNKKKKFDSTIKLPHGTKVYILGTEEGNKFIIKNYKINFISDIGRNHYNSYNYSGKDKMVIDSTFTIKENATEFKKEYVQALEDEKETLMKLYGMDSETYNKLALFSYGVLRPETKFGKDYKYAVKEFAPMLVSVLKGNGFDTSSNSRGPTQIKRIPKKIIEKYGIEKSELSDPRNSAIATLGFSFELLQELRAIDHKHPDIKNDNIYNYLYYLYSGKRYEITKATATPLKNIAIRRILDATYELDIVDHLN